MPKFQYTRRDEIALILLNGILSSPNEHPGCVSRDAKVALAFEYADRFLEHSSRFHTVDKQTEDVTNG